MPDESKPEHYSEKYKREIETLKAEVTRLTDALAATSTITIAGSVPSADATREAMVTQAALYAGCMSAGWEARGGDVSSLYSILMTRWHAVRRFLTDVSSGADVAAYEANQAMEAAESARVADIAKRDEEARLARIEAGKKAQRAMAGGAV